MVAGLGDLRGHPQAHLAVARIEQLELVDVEAEVVEPAQPLAQPVLGLGRREPPLRGELLPEHAVALLERGDDRPRVDVVAEQSAGLEVEQLAEHVVGGQSEVDLALPVRQRGVQLGGLGVEEVGGDLPGVEAEQRVGQRAVAPVGAGEVQPRQQLGERVDEPVARMRAPWPGEQAR